MQSLQSLHFVLDRLQSAGLIAALGGSGLLYAHGLVADCHDWDLTTDAAPEAVAAGLGDLPWQDRTSRDGRFATACRFVVQVDGEEIDLMSRFAIPTEAGVCSIPTRVDDQWQGVPLGSLEAWAVAYRLMGRHAKADMVLRHLAQAGAEAEVIRSLLAQPLPATLRAELARLLPADT